MLNDVGQSFLSASERPTGLGWTWAIEIVTNLVFVALFVAEFKLLPKQRLLAT